MDQGRLYVITGPVFESGTVRHRWNGTDSWQAVQGGAYL